LWIRTRPGIATVSRPTTNKAATIGASWSEVAPLPNASTRSSPSFIAVTKPIVLAMTNDELSRSSSAHDVRSSATRKPIHAAVRNVSIGDSSAA